MEIICTKCKIEKAIEFFPKNKEKLLGINKVCKLCHSEYRKKDYLLNKEKVLNQVNTYKLNNPDKYTKEAIKSFSKKAGRIVETNCCVCNIIVYASKEDIKNNVKKYCSWSCRKTTNKTVYCLYLNQVRKRAKKFNKEFDLTEEYIKELLEIKQNNKCNISNIDIKMYSIKDIKSLANTASLDRIDSSKGYVKDNVQWICLGINYMKLDYSENELFELLNLIKDNYTHR